MRNGKVKAVVQREEVLVLEAELDDQHAKIKALVDAAAEEELALPRLTAEQRREITRFNRDQAMALVSQYTSMQKQRIGATLRIKAHQRRVGILASMPLVEGLQKQMAKLERVCGTYLQVYAESQLLGRWCLSNHGIGPICVAGLLAHIDLNIAKSAGQIWSFAGLNPNQVWEKGEKRPYNAKLKTLCWRLGECLKKVSKHPDCFYGALYQRRKVLELKRDAEGLNEEEAHKRLDKARIKGSRISPAQRKIWESGHLQPIGIDRRAMRWAIKIFLSHYHYVGRTILTGEAPEPWIIVHGGHTKWIEPPNWPMKE